MAQITDYAADLFGEGNAPDYIASHSLSSNIIDIARFDNSGGPGISSFTTIGLSAAPLMRDGEEFAEARLELCGAVDREYTWFGAVIAAASAKVLDGEWVYPGRAMPGLVAAASPGISTPHLLFVEPFLWNRENLAAPITSIGRKVLWLQAVPITEAELQYGLANNMDALTDLLQERGTEPTNLSRPSAITGVSRRQITVEWSIEIDNSFVGRVVDGDLRFVSVVPPVRTIWLAVRASPTKDTPTETLAWIQQNVHPSPQQRFHETGANPKELRYASWYPETVDGRQQWNLNAYTIRRGSYVQAAFVADEPAELNWALATWRSLRYG
jgi:antitoxin YqcF